MNGKDLGTYHLRVEFVGGRGYIEEWSTGMRFTDGNGRESPLNATRIPPAWDSEEDLIRTMVYMYLEGNYSCDCNRARFLARANGQDEPERVECGETIVLQRLTLIRPDASEELIWEAE